jgi:ribonuclease HI
MIYNVYTDGSCNQGADSSANTNGGWAFMVTDIDGVIVFSESDSELNTTNNRAEMLAIIKSVQALSNIGFFRVNKLF